MRTTITTDTQGYVTIAYDDDGERVSRTFFAPVDGGYVREVDSRGQYPQVCDKLYSRGSTLRATRAGLADVIRREWRARQVAEKRAGV